MPLRAFYFFIFYIKFVNITIDVTEKSAINIVLIQKRILFLSEAIPVITANEIRVGTIYLMFIVNGNGKSKQNFRYDAISIIDKKRNSQIQLFLISLYFISA